MSVNPSAPPLFAALFPPEVALISVQGRVVHPARVFPPHRLHPPSLGSVGSVTQSDCAARPL